MLPKFSVQKSSFTEFFLKLFHHWTNTRLVCTQCQWKLQFQTFLSLIVYLSCVIDSNIHKERDCDSHKGCNCKWIKMYAKSQRLYFKNYWNNTRLVCTHLNEFWMPIPKMAQKVLNLQFFCKKLEIWHIICSKNPQRVG